ncbi:MAG: hypothetical protein AAF628_06520 [Planctomycetota bacterium]
MSVLRLAWVELASVRWCVLGGATGLWVWAVLASLQSAPGLGVPLVATSVEGLLVLLIATLPLAWHARRHESSSLWTIARCRRPLQQVMAVTLALAAASMALTGAASLAIITLGRNTETLGWLWLGALEFGAPVCALAPSLGLPLRSRHARSLVWIALVTTSLLAGSPIPSSTLLILGSSGPTIALHRGIDAVGGSLFATAAGLMLSWALTSVRLGR